MSGSKFGLRAVLDGLLKPMGLVKKKGNQYSPAGGPPAQRTGRALPLPSGQRASSPEALYWTFRKGDYRPFEESNLKSWSLALLFSGNILAYQGQRKKGLEDISRTGLQGITALGKGEILSEDLRAAIPQHPLIPDKFRKGLSPFLPRRSSGMKSKPARKERWNPCRTSSRGCAGPLLSRLSGTFPGIPAQDIKDILSQWEEVKVSFPPSEGLERFLSAAAKEPFFSEKLRRLEELKAFFDHAERILFVYQYLSDPRLSIPDRLVYQTWREEKKALLGFFEAGEFPSPGKQSRTFCSGFRISGKDIFRSTWTEHRQARSGDPFIPYEKLRQSRRYQLLSRLDQLEMVSVHHNRSSVDRTLTAVLMSQCNGPLPMPCRVTPSAPADFSWEKNRRFLRSGKWRKSIDLGIQETVEALKSSTYQEKLLPYLAAWKKWERKTKPRPSAGFSLFPLSGVNPFSPSSKRSLTQPSRGSMRLSGEGWSWCGGTWTSSTEPSSTENIPSPRFARFFASG